MPVEKNCEAVKEAISVFGSVNAFKKTQQLLYEKRLMLPLFSLLKYFLAFFFGVALVLTKLQELRNRKLFHGIR